MEVGSINQCLRWELQAFTRHQPCTFSRAPLQLCSGHLGFRKQKFHHVKLSSQSCSRRSEQWHRCMTVAATTSSSLSYLSERQIVDEQEWVCAGVIGPPHGVGGKMKVKPLTDFPHERFGTPGVRWLQTPNARSSSSRSIELIKVELAAGNEAVYKGHNLWVLSFSEIDSREKAESLRGCKIMIHVDSRNALEDEDEFYVQDLVGLKVHLEDGLEPIGIISDVFDGSGGCDLLQVSLQGNNPKDVLIPFVEQFVPRVDTKSGKVVIRPIEGLLDLSWQSKRTNPKKKKLRKYRKNVKPSQSTPSQEA